MLSRQVVGATRKGRQTMENSWRNGEVQKGGVEISPTNADIEQCARVSHEMLAATYTVPKRSNEIEFYAERLD